MVVVSRFGHCELTFETTDDNDAINADLRSNFYL